MDKTKFSHVHKPRHRTFALLLIVSAILLPLQSCNRSNKEESHKEKAASAILSEEEISIINKVIDSQKRKYKSPLCVYTKVFSFQPFDALNDPDEPSKSIIRMIEMDKIQYPSGYDSVLHENDRMSKVGIEECVDLPVIQTIRPFIKGEYSIVGFRRTNCTSKEEVKIYKKSNGVWGEFFTLSSRRRSLAPFGECFSYSKYDLPEGVKILKVRP